MINERNQAERYSLKNRKRPFLHLFARLPLAKRSTSGPTVAARSPKNPLSNGDRCSDHITIRVRI